MLFENLKARKISKRKKSAFDMKKKWFRFLFGEWMFLSLMAGKMEKWDFTERTREKRAKDMEHFD
jgi:hypothetical protein